MRDSLVLSTLHDLLRNKELLSSLKYHIFTSSLFTDLLQSLSSSWLKWLVFEQFTTDIIQSAEWSKNYTKLQSALFTLGLQCALFSLGLILSQHKKKQKATRQKGSLQIVSNTLYPGKK